MAGIVNPVPEGLILLISVMAAVSAFKLAQRGVLAQQLNAIESLASVDTLCTDKTSTLTEPKLEWSRWSQPTARTRRRLRVSWPGTPPAPVSQSDARGDRDADLNLQGTAWHGPRMSSGATFAISDSRPRERGLHADHSKCVTTFHPVGTHHAGRELSPSSASPGSPG